MPSSGRTVFAAAGLEPGGSVRWAAPVLAPNSELATGVYVVACTNDIDVTKGEWRACPLSKPAIDELLEARPELRVDGERPNSRELGERLGGFWLAEESIVYIGLAGPRKRRPRHGELAGRVNDYYKTKLGARSPHTGGWFLKTLSVLDDLVVHYAYCDHVNRAEQQMLNAFAKGVSVESREELQDRERVMPFANLEHPPGVRKRHGIIGATAPRKRHSSPRPDSVDRAPARSVVRSASTSPKTALTQIVRAGDLSAGIIRVPKDTKKLFPTERTRINVELAGEDLGDCRWDPGTGPDKDRSGVIGVGKTAVGSLVTGERLTVEQTEAGVRLT